jgi:hypothetical protein
VRDTLIGHLAIPAALMSGLFAITACAGGDWPSPPAAGGQVGAQVVGQVTALNYYRSNQAQCLAKKFPTGCYTVSLKSGLKVAWCDGPASDRCLYTVNYKWRGNVCRSNAEVCNPIKQMTTAWKGPYECVPSVCGSGVGGAYELDTITPGEGLKQTKRYVYKQDIQYCAGSSCEDATIGLNVGK